MQESSMYQWIVEEGEKKGEKTGILKGKRETLLLLGAKQLGKPGKKVRDAIIGVDQLDRLDELLLRVLDVKTWDDLLKKNGKDG